MAQKGFERFHDIAQLFFEGTDVRIILEVGARDCAETLEFQKAFPQADIYTFECNPATLPLCRHAVQGISKIHLIEKAVTDHDGPVTFFPIDQERTVTGQVDGNPGASSLFLASPDYPEERYIQHEIVVEATSLETFFIQNNIRAIDLVWMDIQGAELLAFRGMGERVRALKLIHVEVEFFEIYQGQPLFPELRAYLTKKGFTFLGFTVYSKFSADAVFVNRQHIGLHARTRIYWHHRYLIKTRLTYLRHQLKRLLHLERRRPAKV
jgi:FkbM family methyltransferase